MSILAETQKGPAEKLLDLVLSSSAHLWHNRPGLDVAGAWHAKRERDDRERPAVAPGLFTPAAERLFARLVDIYGPNAELMARFASYALTQTGWRDESGSMEGANDKSKGALARILASFPPGRHRGGSRHGPRRRCPRSRGHGRPGRAGSRAHRRLRR